MSCCSSSSVPAADVRATDADADADCVRPSSWLIPSSLASQRTINPIRAIVDKLVVPTHHPPSKQLIPLSIGDPTVFGNLLPPSTATAALVSLVTDNRSNGYAPSYGIKPARDAVANKFNQQCPHQHTVTGDDVLICSGASGALEIIFDALLNSGDNILIPRPGFSLYATIAGHLNVEVRYYDLLPDQQWECDLQQMRTLVDARTRFVLINNPSNPNGSNFSLDHLRSIVSVAEDCKLPIVADEIYADMVFEGQTFTPIANITHNVPVISVGGIAKQYVVPGWRIGWLVFHDRNGLLVEAKSRSISLTQLILGSNTLVQALVPNLLNDTPQQYYTQLNNTLQTQAMFLYQQISNIHGLQPIKPQGAMYLMVRIVPGCFSPSLSSDVEFSALLLQEEMVVVLPGSCFQAHNMFRIVTCAPVSVMQQAVDRIKNFVDRHKLQQ